MRLLNRYYRDPDAAQSLDKMCSISFEAYGNDDDGLFSLQTEITFQLRDIEAYDRSEKPVRYVIGFEEAHLELAITGGTVVIKTKYDEPSDQKVTVAEGEEAEQSRNRGFWGHIGAAFSRGGADAGVKVEASASNNRKQFLKRTAENEFTPYNILISGESSWRFRDWDHPERVLDGRRCGGGAALCEIIEHKEDLVVDARMSVETTHLTAFRQAPGRPIAEADERNLNAVATALVQKAFVEAEAEQRHPLGDKTELTLATARLKSALCDPA